MSSPPTGTPFPDSLCHRCRWHRIVRGGRSSFVLCQEPSLPRYAPQPVVRCAGFAPGDPDG